METQLMIEAKFRQLSTETHKKVSLIGFNVIHIYTVCLFHSLDFFTSTSVKMVNRI